MLKDFLTEYNKAVGDEWVISYWGGWDNKPVCSNCAYEIIILHIFVFWMQWFIVFQTFFVTFVLLAKPRGQIEVELHQSNSIVFLYFFPLILSSFTYIWDFQILPFISVNSFCLCYETFFLFLILHNEVFLSFTNMFFPFYCFFVPFVHSLYHFISSWSLILPVNISFTWIQKKPSTWLPVKNKNKKSPGFCL